MEFTNLLEIIFQYVGILVLGFTLGWLTRSYELGKQKDRMRYGLNDTYRRVQGGKALKK
jgi:hypothetical protein